MLFQKVLIESKLDSSSFQPHMYDMKQLCCFKSTLISPAERNLSLHALPAELFLLFYASGQHLSVGAAARTASHTLSRAFGRVNKRHTAALSTPSIESQQADAQVARL